MKRLLIGRDPLLIEVHFHNLNYLSPRSRSTAAGLVTGVPAHDQIRQNIRSDPSRGLAWLPTLVPGPRTASKRGYGQRRYGPRDRHCVARLTPNSWLSVRRASARVRAITRDATPPQSAFALFVTEKPRCGVMELQRVLDAVAERCSHTMPSEGRGILSPS